MDTYNVYQEIQNAWNTATKKVIEKIDFFLEFNIDTIPPNTETQFIKYLTMFGDLYSEKNEKRISINIFKDSKSLYDILRLSIISEWAYRNLPAYAENNVTLSQLCKNAHEIKQNHKRITDRITKSCTNIIAPSPKCNTSWHSLFSILKDSTENTKLPLMYSYNTMYQIVFHWNLLLGLNNNAEDLDINIALDSLTKTLFANIQEVSGSKKGLGNIAPEYIIHHYNEEFFDSYFFLELLYNLINLKKNLNIEEQTKNEIINFYNELIDQLPPVKTENSTKPSDDTEQKPATYDYEDIFKNFLYKYDQLQIAYFIYLYTAIPIGKCHSVYMKSYYLKCFTNQFLSQKHLLFPAIEQVSLKGTKNIRFFDIQIKFCNTIFQTIYRYFTIEMQSKVSEINFHVATDRTFFDNYFAPISNYSDKLYAKIQNLKFSTYFSKDIITLIKDLLKIKSTNYSYPDKWQAYYLNLFRNDYFFRVMMTTPENSFPLNPTSNHFVTIAELFHSDNTAQKEINSLLEEYEIRKNNAIIIQ